MSSSLMFARKFIVFFGVFLLCKSIQSIYLSASALPDDQLRKILLTSFTDFEPDRAKKALMEFYKFFASNPETAQDHPPPNWNSEENDVLSEMSDEPYHVQSIKNFTTFPKSCAESPTKGFRLKGFAIRDYCPYEFSEKRLSHGTIPLVLFELRCLCEGHKCSGGLATCKAIKKMVPVIITKPNGASDYTIDLVSVTVGCLCAQKLAPEADYKQIESLDF